MRFIGFTVVLHTRRIRERVSRQSDSGTPESPGGFSRFMDTYRAAAMLIIIFCVNSIAGAQGKEGAFSFERNDRRLTWQNTNKGDFRFRPNVRLAFDSALSTSLSMTTGPTLRDRWHDQIVNRADLNWNYSDRLDLRMTMKEDWSKDTMSRMGSSFLTTDLGGAIGYRPLKDLDLRGTLSHIHDERFENRDNGAILTGNLLYTWNPGIFSRSVAASLAANGGSSTLRRTNDNGRIEAKIAYLNPFANVDMRLNDNRSIRGYFAESTDETGVSQRKDIEERASYDRGMTVTINRGNVYGGWDQSGFEVRMGLEDRRMEDSANDKDPTSPKYHTNSRGNLRDFNLKYSGSLGQTLRGQVEAGYGRNENNVQRAIRSRTQTDVTARGIFDIVLTRSDSLNFTGWIKRTRIDTPPEVRNDRDELKIDGGIQYMRRWAENFNTTLDFRALNTHYVNIAVTQSSQNKWVRTFRLSPSFMYTPSDALRIRHTVDIQADYMEYDFDKGPTPRSTITRRVSSESWVTGVFSPTVEATVGAMFEENEFGRLNNRGGKITAEEGDRRFIDLSVRYEFARWLIFIPRYVHAMRKDRSVERNALERREIDQTFGMDVRLFENRRRDGYEYVLSGKRIVRETLNNAPQIRNYISMTLTYGF